mmetsp:Transcript_15797/g.23799  ORF Transcript_15797/g.23799 Transcript_15797/m.23799 type:complete len:484 (-) Transcript_15797:248-1699(-)
MGSFCSFCYGVGGHTINDGKANEHTPLLTKQVWTELKKPSCNHLYDAPRAFNQRYELRGVLGHGATGFCHACIDKYKMEAFACKVVNLSKYVDRNKYRILQRLMVEVKVLQKLRHKNIVRAQDFFEDEDHLFIIMELIPGGELFQQIVKVGSFSEKQAAGVIRDVADGLSYIHQMGVIHRDLKPENLLVPGPQLRPVKICDFGLAFNKTFGNSPKTFVGSPRYMAPEQMLGTPYNEKVDVWALGIILFILLSGNLPFEPTILQQNAQQNAAKGERKLPVRQLALRFQGSRWNKVSRAAKALIFSCLNIDPEIRFSADRVLTHSWLNGKAPATLVQNSEHLKRYLFDKRSNGTIFLEPNTLGHRYGTKEKIALTHRNRRSHPINLGRGFNTPDHSPSSSPETSISRSSGSLLKSPNMLANLQRFSKGTGDSFQLSPNYVPKQKKKKKGSSSWTRKTGKLESKQLKSKKDSKTPDGKPGEMVFSL